MRILQVTKRHKQALAGLFFVGAVALIFFASEGWASDPQVERSGVPSAPRLRHAEYKTLESLRVLATTTTTTTTTTSRPEPSTTVTSTSSTTTTTRPQIEAQTISADWVAQCHAWAKLAGIDLPASAITLLDRESDCNPTVRNPNSSAGGIPQALPWTKMGCVLEYTDEAAVCQLKWMHGYVFGRYGGWDQALAHSHRVGWY
jgi:hypothetical protein